MSKWLYDLINLFFLKRRVRKMLPDDMVLTCVEVIEEPLPTDRAYITPIDGFEHVNQDCPCIPDLIPSVRENGTEFWIVRHKPMDIT